VPDPDLEIKGGVGGPVTQTLRQEGSITGGAWFPPNFFGPIPGPSPGSTTDLKCAEQELNRAFIVNIGQMSHGILASSY